MNSLLDRMIGEADACRKKQNNNTKKPTTFNITKADEDQRLVFGWALVAQKTDGETIIDHQGDMVDPDELEKGAYEYVLKFRDAGEEHLKGLRKKAKMVESCVFTPEKMKALGIPEGTVPVGWWIGFYVDDDKTWELIKNGTYQMFSIEGKAIREPVNEPLTKKDFDEWQEDHPDDDYDDDYEEEHMNENRVAKTFSEILKYNPNHDNLGRFSSGSGGAGGNVISFPSSSSNTGNSDKWNYPGIQEATDKIESQVNNVKGQKQAADVYRAIKQQEQVINRAIEDIENGTENGNMNILLTQRRRLRMAQRKLLQNGELG